eukprot:1160529-Pelagomonas_calceolata.AAC.5
MAQRPVCVKRRPSWLPGPGGLSKDCGALLSAIVICGSGSKGDACYSRKSCTYWVPKDGA